MAGPTAEFTAADAAEAVAGIRLAQEIGAPNNDDDRPTFYWKQDKTYAVATPDGAPYSWTDTPASEEEAVEPVQVPVSVEYLDSAGNPIEEAVGNFNPDRARLTFVDNYEDVADFDWVTLGQTKYYWRKKLPPFGLGSIEVVQVLVAVSDEA